MPVESRDDLVKRLDRWLATFGEPMGNGRSNPDNDMIYLLRDVSTRIASDAKRIAELETERDEARLLVTEANNSLFGSQGYFHSLNSVPFDKHHLSRAIEDLKENARRAITAERELDTANANHRDMASRLKDMGTRLETAERALAEERERHQWRTIDSAPTNGDTFLAWEGSERGPFKCWWRDDWPYDESCWMDPQDSEPAPTHWKPLDVPDATAIRSGKPDGKE